MNHLQFMAIMSSCMVMMHAQEEAPKKAIVIGASSGMGREIARLLSREGYELGICGRRVPLLQTLQAEIGTPCHIKALDARDPHARENLQTLIDEMGGIDMLVISISAYLDNREQLDGIPDFSGILKTWEKSERSIDVEFKGFISLADVGLAAFKKQNHGHLVGISSTSGVRGSAGSPIYSAAKAGISCYMEGIRNQMMRDHYNVQVTDVIPGFVAVEHSPMGEDPNAYWEISTQQAGQIILEGIKRQQSRVYVPYKTWFLALLLKVLPDCIYQRYFNWM